MKSNLIISFGLLLFISCETKQKEVSILVNQVNSQGKAYSSKYAEEYDLDPYELQENYVIINFDNSIYWNNINLYYENSLLEIEPIFIKEKTEFNSFLYNDDLKFGAYSIQYISDFQDTIRQEFILNGNIRISLNTGLNNYYEKKQLDDSILSLISKGDTLQFLYKSYGCFDFEQELIEIFKDGPKVKARISSWNEPWKELIAKDLESKIKLLIQEGTKINGVDDCSLREYYTFKRKGERIMYEIIEGDCHWSGIEDIL